MKEILIKSISSKGDKALEQHIKETKKLSIKERLLFKTAGYKQEIIDDKNIILKVNNSRANNPIFLDLIVGEINNALELNGAVRGEDFTTEVKDND